MERYVLKKVRSCKKKSKKTKLRIAIIVVLSFLILILFYYFKVVCPIIVRLSEEKIRSLATTSISEVVEYVMQEEKLSYNELVDIKYDSSNNIELIEVNTIKVNNVIRDITKGVQDKFNVLSHEGIGISLGTFTGVPFLYGIGPNISIKLVPVGTVNTKVISNFNAQGINQTLHRLYFVVIGTIGMVLPIQTQNFVTELEVLICESIIVGKIPDVYLQGNLI